MNCLHCDNTKVVKNGRLGNDGQRFRCNACKHDFSIGSKRGTISQNTKNSVINLYCHKKIPIRKLSTEFGISTSSILSRSKIHKKNCKLCINI